MEHEELLCLLGLGTNLFQGKLGEKASSCLLSCSRFFSRDGSSSLKTQKRNQIILPLSGRMFWGKEMDMLTLEQRRHPVRLEGARRSTLQYFILGTLSLTCFLCQIRVHVPKMAISWLVYAYFAIVQLVPLCFGAQRRTHKGMALVSILIWVPWNRATVLWTRVVRWGKRERTWEGVSSYSVDFISRSVA